MGWNWNKWKDYDLNYKKRRCGVKIKHLKEMGGLSAIREIKYKYPSFLSFPVEWGEEREGDFDILLPNWRRISKWKWDQGLPKHSNIKNPRI